MKMGVDNKKFSLVSNVMILYTDINECELKDEYPCYGCKNTIGSYTCTCPSGTRGNPYTKDGCQKKDGFTLAIKIVIGKFFLMLIYSSHFFSVIIYW
jgi:hypothetical protein